MPTPLARPLATMAILILSCPAPLTAQGMATFTYSRSNLLDGQLDLANGLTAYDVVRGVEEALALWSSVAPLNFVEVPDAGPPVSDLEYPALGLPVIRIGHHDFSGNTLAHAYFPGNSGLASDLHLDSSNRVWTESLLFTTLVHELGHALGLDHIEDSLSIMNSTLGGSNILPGIEAGFLFPPEIAAIEQRWGPGQGEVIATRHWTGAETARWSDDANWQEGWRPTLRTDVRMDRGGTARIDDDGHSVRSLTLGGGINELRIGAAGDLQVTQGVILGAAQGGTPLIQVGASAKLHVPSDGQDQLGWLDPGFDDTAWQDGPTAIGFERSNGFESLIQTSLEAEMYNRRSSFYARLEFEVSDPDQLDFLQLRMQYDDGFVAYLNGSPVASANAPRTTSWNSSALRSREDDEALQFESFELTDWRAAVRPGRNVLAIQGLNHRIGSSDLLLSPQLSGGPIDSRLLIDGGRLDVGGDLHLASAASSETQLELLDGTLLVRGNLTSGAGQGRLEIRGGVLQVQGGASPTQLIATGDSAAILVPRDGSLEDRWKQVGYDDQDWQQGPTGIGFERDAGLAARIATDVEEAMFDQNATAYVRVPFEWRADAGDSQLTLRMQYDDGFVAYLNGYEIARANAPDDPAWNSRATRSVDNNAPREFIDFDITPFASLLLEGPNVLAVQGLNRSADSSEFLLVPELTRRPIGGRIEVDRLDFYGGQIRDVVEIAGELRHHDGTLSPQHPLDPDRRPGRLTIDGEYRMDPEATLRLDRFDDGAETLEVTGRAEIAGTLALHDAQPSPDDAPLLPGATQQWPLLRAGQLEASFAQVTRNGHDWAAGHQEAGLFQQLVYDTTSVSLVSYRALPGDADGDGLFDSSDLLDVFRVGQYEDGIEDNSDWTGGDWTGDDDFMSDDLVAALQAGGYSTAAQFAQPVPEPAGGLPLAVLGLSWLVRGRRSHRRRATRRCGKPTAS